MSKKGFTLLELLIVVIVVAILSSIAVMYYGRFIERVRITEADTGATMPGWKGRALFFWNYCGIFVENIIIESCYETG